MSGFKVLLECILQVENLQPLSQGNARYRNTFEGLSTIVRNQGWKQLFAGLSINYIKVMLLIHGILQLILDSCYPCIFADNQICTSVLPLHMNFLSHLNKIVFTNRVLLGCCVFGLNGKKIVFRCFQVTTILI